MLFFFMVFLFISFSFYSRTVLDAYSAAYDRQIEMQSTIAVLKKSFTDSGIAMADYLGTGNRIRLADFNNHFTAAKGSMKDLYNQVLDDEVLYLLRSVEITAESYFRESSNVSFIYNSRKTDYYGRFYYTQSILGYLQKYCDELTGLILENSLTENQALTEKRSQLRFWNTTLNFFLIFLLAGFLLYVTSRITHPLERLVVQARSLSSGNFDARVRVRNPNNSVGVLAEAFNSMAASIKSMMQEIHDNMATERKLFEEQRKNIEYEELLNQATFLALQTQTNPHFLFNTLSSISRSVSLGKKDQTLLMIDALASLLRYSLTDAAKPVLLGEELAVTKEYLSIQTLRFKDRIHAHFSIEEGIENLVTLPRFTLQPLVENAVVHGLEPKEGQGILVINAKRRADTAIIRIYDDGGGITKDKLESILSQQTPSHTKRIGIWNTLSRIRLFTRSNDSFTIISRASGGMLITIRLSLEDNFHV
ncbi:hypothetical protein MASR2M78_33710 [Treponema sp.]